MNLVRQFIAMAILLIAHRILFSGKKKYLYIIFVGIATLFHSMSAIFIVSLFLERKEIKFKHYIIIIALILLLGGQIGNIVDFVVTNTPLKDITNIAKYVRYFKMGGNLTISSVIVESVIYVYIYVMFNKLKEKNDEVEKEAVFFVNMQTLTLLCTIMNIHFELFFRVTLLFSIFQVISIPYFWFKNKDESLKFLKFTIKKGTTVLTILILCVMSARMIYSNIIKGADQVFTYKTIYDREREFK